MVELFEQNIRQNDRQSSKGNQLKWENEGIWYKADYTGYEGLAEYVISHLLEKSSLKTEEYVLYNPVQIRYKKRVYNGVESHNFLKPNWQIITLERLFKSHTGLSLYESIWKIRDHSERLEFLVEYTERMTGLRDFGKYISCLLALDAFFLNEDRHMHNIAVLMNDQGQFDYCPIFDNGAGLLSDTMMDYPMGEDVLELMETVESKTISFDFDEQLDIAESQYGCQVHFQFNKEDVDQLLEAVDIYSKAEKERVRTVIYQQMRKYAYMF